tara:strand:+ start:78 stop:347 length:270 start_codon:yes stop_codon:yes gene_type:complete
MSSDTYWLKKDMPGGEKLYMFEIVHPEEPSNGTDGTPQVRINTFLDGKMKDYDHINTLEDARRLWCNSIGQGFVRVEAVWTEELGASVI